MTSSSSPSSRKGSSDSFSDLTTDSFKISPPPSTSTPTLPQQKRPPPDEQVFLLLSQAHTKTLLVSSLGPDVCPSYIRNLFVPFGSIKSLRVLWERGVDTIAAIEFEDQHSAEKAWSDIHLVTEINWKYRYGNKTPPQQKSCSDPAPDQVEHFLPNHYFKKTLLVKSLGPDVAPDYIRNLFLPYGFIKSIRVIWERDVDTIAFIEYEDQTSAEKAMSVIDHITKKNWKDRYENECAMKTTTSSVRGEGEAEVEDIRGKTGKVSADPDNAISSRTKTMVKKEEARGFSVFIGNTQNLTEEDLIEAFQPYGRIMRVFLRRSKGFAYLTFADEFSVGDALRGMDGAAVKDTRIRVDWDRNPEKKTRVEKDAKREENKNFTVFVGATGDLTEEDLSEAFKLFGEIRNVLLVRDKETGRSMNFGFVTYADLASARDAIREMDGATVKNTTIDVMWDHGGKAKVRNRKEARVEGEEEDELERQREYDIISKQASPDNNTIFVCYRQGILTDQILRKKFGKITGLKCYKDKGYGFIRFQDRSSAIRAIYEWNGVRTSRGVYVNVGWGKL